MKVKAKLDGIFSPDLPSGYSELPECPDNCWIIVHADIGLDDGNNAADCFTFYVSTPKYLSQILTEGYYQAGRALVIVNEFDWFVVEEAIGDICSKVVGDSWEKIAEQLSKYGEYEFE